MKAIFPLTLISSLRFFGLFIVLPIIGLYTDEFHTTAFLAGLAAGGYALTQISFQTPFGIWSDKYNRKHIVGIGLFIFLLGSLVCAFAENITTMLIIGRSYRERGAVGGVVSARIADLVKEETQQSNGDYGSWNLHKLCFSYASKPHCGKHIWAECPISHHKCLLCAVLAYFILESP